MSRLSREKIQASLEKNPTIDLHARENGVIEKNSRVKKYTDKWVIDTITQQYLLLLRDWLSILVKNQ